MVTVPEAGQTVFKFQLHHLLAMCPWNVCNLHFLMSKSGIIINMSRLVKISWIKPWKVLSPVSGAQQVLSKC